MNFPDWSDFGPKMQALDERRRRFVWAFLMNTMADGDENATQAAVDAGWIPPNEQSTSVRVRAHKLMHETRVLDAMQEVASSQLRGLAVPAVVMLGKMVRKPDHPDHRKALEMVLNRTGMHERTAVDVNVGGSVEVNHRDAALEDFKRMVGLGVPEAKLVEVFGFSGVSRYRRMLSDGAKVVEHEP